MPSLHVLMSCVGSAGDVFPFIAIGQALRARGHRVELLASPYFRARIAAAGLGFVATGTLDDYERAVADPDLWHPRRSFPLLWRNIERNLRDAYRDIVERAGSDTVLVGSTLAFNSRLAQEKLGLPGATVHLSPSCIFSAIEPAQWPGLAWLRRLPPWLTRAVLNAIERAVLDRVMLPGLNAFRAELGLPATRRVMSHWLNSPQQVICAFPAWFAAAQPDWPANSVTVDFPRWAGSTDTELDPALRDFLAAGPAPIGITPGSAMAHARPVFEHAVAACAALGLRALIVTPYREQLPAIPPAFALQVDYAPFGLLLPKLAGLVHHGGIGTSAQCLAAGVPQLVTPFAHDQFDNAARLRRLGVARSLAPDAATHAWIEALRELTHSPEVAAACTDLAQKIATERSAAERIADRIETLHATS